MNGRLLETSAYQGRPVLITGALGFMGLNLALALHHVGACVRLLDIGWPERDEHIAPALKQMEFIKADLRDHTLLEAAVEGCDLIFNLAGRSGAESSNVSPFEDLDINCRGQLTLLEACRKCNPHVKVIFPSSRLVYAPTTHLPVAETAFTEPLSVYGINKLAGEKYHQLYAHQYGLRATILRITNPYGPHQRPEQRRYGVVNWFIHLALSGQSIPIYGDGLQIRDYIHIDDVIRAFLMAGGSDRADGRIFNVGSSRGIRLVDMAHAIVKWSGNGRVERVPWPLAAKQSESGDFVADITLIGQVLGWRPEIPFEGGFEQVIEYYRSSNHAAN
jgi:nucleoside-diphosphate-sugar epimerase